MRPARRRQAAHARRHRPHRRVRQVAEQAAARAARGATTSESTKPTNGVAQAASPELRAAAGPRGHRVAHQPRPAGGADRAHGRRRDGAVVHDHDRTLRTRPRDRRPGSARAARGGRAPGPRPTARRWTARAADAASGSRPPAAAGPGRRSPAPSPTGDGTRQRETTRAPLSVRAMSRSGVPPASRRPPARIRVSRAEHDGQRGRGRARRRLRRRPRAHRASATGRVVSETAQVRDEGGQQVSALRRPTRAGHPRGRRWATRPAPRGRAAPA